MRTDEPDMDRMLNQAEDSLSRGKFSEAVATLEEARTRFSNSPLPAHSLGVAYLRRLEADIEQNALWEDQTDEEAAYQSAHEAFSEALDIDPDFVPSLNNLGTLEAMRQRYTEATRLWTHSLDLNPGQDQIREDLEAIQKETESQ